MLGRAVDDEIGPHVLRIFERPILRALLDEEIKRIVDRHVGDDVDLDLQLVDGFREDVARQPVAVRILLMVHEMVGGRNLQRVRDDPGAAVGRGPEPDDLRAERDRAVVFIVREVMDCGSDRHGFRGLVTVRRPFHNLLRRTIGRCRGERARSATAPTRPPAPLRRSRTRQAPPACAAARALRPRSAASTSKAARSPCAPAIGAAGLRARRRSRRRRSASLARRNGRAIDACVRSWARARAQAIGAPRHVPRPLTRQSVSDFWPAGSTFIHQPILSSSRPSGRSMVPSSPSGEPATIAQ